MGILKKKKVLYVITKSNWGGAQRYVYDLATSLPKEDYEVAVALGGTGDEEAPLGALAEKLKQAKVPVVPVQHFMRNVSLTREVLALFELVRLLWHEKPDVVHLNSSKAGGLGALAARIAGACLRLVGRQMPRIIFTIHGLPSEETWRSTPARKAIAFFTWLTCLLSHTVITVSSANYATVQKWWLPEKRIVRIHNGIGGIAYVACDQAREILYHMVQPKKEDGSPMDAASWQHLRLICSIGDLTPNKGFGDAMEAMRLLAQTEKHFAYVIMGEGEARTALEARVHEASLGHIVYLPGNISDAASLLSACDIFLLSSRKEGLPYVLLEAGGTPGVTIIATDISGVRDILIEGKETYGTLVPPCDPVAIAKAIAQRLADLKTHTPHADAVQAHIKKAFSLERMVQETCMQY